MAKSAKTAIKVKDAKSTQDAKSFTKVVRTVKTKAGNYTFKESIVHKDKIKDFLSHN